jgi:hypothetical protein
MPKQYEAIRDAEIAKGTPAADAKAKAARIYNAKRKPGSPPVTGHERRLSDALPRKH